MSDVAKEALMKLFKLGDKIEPGERMVSLAFNGKRFPPYHHIKSIDEKDAVHATLENAVRFGAIRIEWVRAYKDTEIDKICLEDISKLSSFLGEKTLADRITSAQAKLSEISHETAWLNKIYDGVVEGWKVGKKPLGLTPEDVGNMAQLYALVEYLENEKNELDMRTVSARLFNDTKLIETKLLGKLVAVYKLHLNKENADAEEILTDISLEKYPWPVFISAEINVIAEENKQLYCGIKPFAGIPPDAIKDVQIVGDVSYVLSIENFSSFNTHTRQIHDGGIIIYTNGFPNKRLSEFYKTLLKKIGDDVPVYHWGDVDVGGFRILAKMQEYASTFGYIVNPHLMDPVSNYSHDFTKTEISDFMKMTHINDKCDKLLYEICTIKKGKAEQEYLTACSPIKQTRRTSTSKKIIRIFV